MLRKWHFDNSALKQHKDFKTKEPLPDKAEADNKLRFHRMLLELEVLVMIIVRVRFLQ